MIQLIFTITYGKCEFFGLLLLFALLYVCGACHIFLWMLLERNWILGFLPTFWTLAFWVIQLATYFKELPISVLYNPKNDSIYYDAR